MKSAFTLLCMLVTLATNAQEVKEHVTLGKAHAKQMLKELLSDTSFFNAIKNTDELLIAKKEMAIAIAEPYLFSIYGKDAILGEKPYEAYLIDNNWVILGTLPEGMLGGTFLIILSATDGRVVCITHGK